MLSARDKYKQLHVRAAEDAADGMTHLTAVEDGPPEPGCNIFWRGRLTPSGEYEICCQTVASACGVRGCGACFCSECLTGRSNFLWDDHEDVAGNRPSYMEKCSFCHTALCHMHQQGGLMLRCDVCDANVCADCSANGALELPIVKCEGRHDLWGGPCRQRVCARHARLCIVESKEIYYEPPHKFQALPYTAFVHSGAATPAAFIREVVHEMPAAGLSSRAMCEHCADRFVQGHSREWQSWQNIIAEVEAREPVGDGTRRLPRCSTIRWVCGTHEVCDSAGLRGWLRLGMTKHRVFSGSLTLFGTGERDAPFPADGSVQQKTLAKWFVGLGKGWEADQRALPTPVNEPFNTTGVARASGGSKAAPRTPNAASDAVVGNIILPGVRIGAEAAPDGSLYYDGYSNLGAHGTLRLWRVCDRDGTPTGLLKGALSFPGRDERHFHFTCFPPGCSAPRANSAYLEGELDAATAREAKRRARMQKQRGGTADVWRSEPYDEEDGGGGAGPSGGAGGRDDDDASMDSYEYDESGES